MKEDRSEQFESQFKSFDRHGCPAHAAERPLASRAELGRLGLAGFIAPRADRHQNEYVPASDERLLWLTGFSGSAGLAIVLHDKAALFVDGRYTLQAPSQIDTAIYEALNIAEIAPADWIESSL